MSISDLIVVMKDGVVQQIGKPQEVYDNPANLFVAKFLGTPPVNLFDGYVKDQKLYIGDTPVLEVAGEDRDDLTVAIRPEGFLPCQSGALVCQLKRVEVMGRDISVVCGHPSFTGENFRAIIDSDELKYTGSNTISFRLKPHKVLLFRKDNGARIRI